MPADALARIFLLVDLRDFFSDSGGVRGGGGGGGGGGRKKQQQNNSENDQLMVIFRAFFLITGLFRDFFLSFPELFF